MNKNIIPIFFCFDFRYIIPAAITFYSLLANSNTNYFYKLYILHSDINDSQKAKLKQTIINFKNAEIIFIDMQNKLNSIWNQVEFKGHYSKECLYKFLPASIFSEYDKIICSDVDIVFSGDIAPSYTDYELKDNYIAGIKIPGKLHYFYNQNVSSVVKKENLQILKNGIAAGYLVYNLKQIREDHLEEKFLDYIKNNISEITQPEQDILNLICYPKISFLPLKYCFCTYMYNLFSKKEEVPVSVQGKLINYFFKLYEKNWQSDSVYSKEELKQAFTAPVQIHYATNIKPWNRLFTKRKLIWLKYLAKTPFLFEYIINFEFKNLLKYLFLGKF